MKSPFHFLKAAKTLQLPSSTEGVQIKLFDCSTNLVKKSRRYPFRVYQLGGLSLLSTVAGVLFGVSPAQAAPVSLQFTNATCETNTSGTAVGTATYCLTQGSVWRFSNVIVGATSGSQRDARVTISTLFNGATLATIDDTANGISSRFQPSVVSTSTANLTEYAKFNIQFVAPGTTTVAAVGGEVYETAFDVDGDESTGTTGLRELVEFGTPVSSTLDNPTLLTANAPVISIGGASYIVAQSASNQAGIGISNQYKVTALYNASTTNFDLILGGKTGSTACGGGACARFSSVSFDVTEVVPLNDVVVTKTHTGNFSQGQTGATYSLTVSNYGALATSGTVTVVDTIPTGLTATAASGTGWICTLNQPAAGQVKCTRSDALAFGASYPPITLTVNVATNASSSITNSATVSGGGDYYTGNNSATDPTTVNTLAHVLLVKRITAVTDSVTGTTTTFNQVLDRPGFAADDPTNNWPTSFLKGAYDAGFIKPGDIIEYTVYFIDSSGSDAANVRICDRLVGVQQFVPDAYGAGKDIEYRLGTNPVQYLTKTSDTVDRAELNPSIGAITGCPAPSITGTNNGTVVIDITGSGSSGQQSLTTLPGATAPGTPTNSYGYFRFKTRVNP